MIVTMNQGIHSHHSSMATESGIDGLSSITAT